MTQDEPRHPNGIHLDALALGGDDANAVPASVADHVRSCALCTDYVTTLRQEISVSPSLSRPSLASVTQLPAARERRTWQRRLITVGPVFAAAAALLVYVRFSGLRTEAGYELGTVPSGSGSQEQVHFKGGLPLAVIRERDGAQTRHTDRVEIRPGDRLRLEVAVDNERPISAGVLEEDGTFVPLLPSALLSAGTHYSDQAARVDDHPSKGWIVAGDPEAVRRACATRNWTDVAALPMVLDPAAPSGARRPHVDGERKDDAPP